MTELIMNVTLGQFVPLVKQIKLVYMGNVTHVPYPIWSNLISSFLGLHSHLSLFKMQGFFILN